MGSINKNAMLVSVLVVEVVHRRMMVVVRVGMVRVGMVRCDMVRVVVLVMVGVERVVMVRNENQFPLNATANKHFCYSGKVLKTQSLQGFL